MMFILIQPDQEPAFKKIRVLEETTVEVGDGKMYKCKESLDGVSWVRDRLLGTGGCGSVSSATKWNPNSVNIPTQVVVKSRKLRHASTLIHEKSILSSLTTSPHVIKCYGDVLTPHWGEGDACNVLLELCELSLHDRIMKCEGSGFPDMEVRVYTKDILRGLKHVHGENIIHCDIKPENILLKRDELVRKGSYAAKLADFGVAVDKKSGNEPRSRRGTYTVVHVAGVGDGEGVWVCRR